MLASLFDVKTALRSRRQQRTADLLSLVRAIAQDKPVDTDELLRATEIAGLTDEEVFDLVDLARRRIELRSVAALKPAADKEVGSLDSAIAAADAALNEARARHAKAVEPLARKRDEAAEMSVKAQAAAESLLYPRNLPAAIAARLESARQDLLQAGELVAGLEREDREQSKRSEDAVETLKRLGHDPAKVEQAWRDESQRRDLSNDVVTLVTNMVRGARRAVEAREKLPAAESAQAEAKAAFDRVTRESREF